MAAVGDPFRFTGTTREEHERPRTVDRLECVHQTAQGRVEPHPEYSRTETDQVVLVEFRRIDLRRCGHP